MKGIIWNCRGIQKKGVSSFLKDLIHEHNFHFIGLQETMLENVDDKILRKIDPNGVYLWKWIPARGKSGGILSGVNTDLMEVGSFFEGKYILQLNLWDKQMKTNWNFMNIYGAAQEEHKREFLIELAGFCSKHKVPFLAGGDFNIIRFSSEKNKVTSLSKHSRIFNNIISTYELIDIPMTGGRFTWSNNHADPTLERLDRFLMSKDWEDCFPEVYVFKLPRELSDHNPLILSTHRAVQHRKLSFKFELAWLKGPNFLPLVKSIWDKPCHTTTALDRMQSKLKRFKQFFKGWGFDRQGT